MRTICVGRGLGLVLLITAAGRAAAPEHLHYAGFLDGKIAVSMELTTQEGGKVGGTYQYAIAGKDLYLAGALKGSAVVLTETTRDDKTTGTFRLMRNTDGSLTGTWTSGDAKRVLEVGLARVAETVTLAARKPDAYNVETGYLQFPLRNDFLRDLNDLLAAEAAHAQPAALKEALADGKEQAKLARHEEWSSQSDPHVTYADAGFISIRTMKYAYTGGAHGNYGYTAANYAWRNGLVVLKLSDIVDTRPAALQSMAKACIKSLTAQKATSPDDLVFNSDHPPTLNVTRAGLLFTFDPYAVGSYAEGVYTVLIPWKEAGEYVPATSAVRRLMEPAAVAPPADKPDKPEKAAPAPAGTGADFPRPG